MMILGLPRRDQKKARYGLVGAFGFRIAATLLATWLIAHGLGEGARGLYLLYLCYEHFFRGGGREENQASAGPALAGHVALWGTVFKVELVNIAFSVDSILVAVAMSKTWVVLAGGLLSGIIAIRVVIRFAAFAVVRKNPAIVDGALHHLSAWVGLKLLLGYLRRGLHPVRREQVVLVRVDRGNLPVSTLCARRLGPAPGWDAEDEAARLIEREG